MITHRNRRFGERIQTDLPATCIFNGRTRETRTLDLSPTGAMLLCGPSDEPPMLHELELNFMTRRQQIRTLVRRVWTDGQRVGVRFVGMHDVDRLEIAEELDRLAG